MRNYTVNGININATEWNLLRAVNRSKENWSQTRIETYLGGSMQHLRETELLKKKEDGWGCKRGIMKSFKPCNERITPGSRRPLVSSPLDSDEFGEIPHDALSVAADNCWVVNEAMRKRILDAQWEEGTPAAIIRSTRSTAFHEGPLFHDTFCDWRGRVYSMSGEFGSLLHNRAVRAMLDAPVAEDVSPEAYNYMLQCIEQEFGVTMANYRQVMDLTITNTTDAQRVRAALAIHEVETTGATAYMLEQDASCSGGQIIALLTGDRNLAEATNIIPSESGERQDIYRRLSEALSMEPFWHALGLAGPLHAKTRRSLAKPVIMVSFYGGKEKGILNNMWLTYNGEFEGEGDDAKPCGYIRVGDAELHVDTAERLIKAMTRQLNQFPGFQAILAWAQKSGHHVENHLDGCWAWETATGFVAASTTITSAGLMPNFVHSIDGAIVQTVLTAVGDSFPIGTVHDAFFTTPAHALELKNMVKEAYVAVLEDTMVPQDHGDFEPNLWLLDQVMDSLCIGEMAGAYVPEFA